MSGSAENNSTFICTLEHWKVDNFPSSGSPPNNAAHVDISRSLCKITLKYSLISPRSHKVRAHI